MNIHADMPMKVRMNNVLNNGIYFKLILETKISIH